MRIVAALASTSALQVRGSLQRHRGVAAVAEFAAMMFWRAWLGQLAVGTAA